MNKILPTFAILLTLTGAGCSSSTPMKTVTPAAPTAMDVCAIFTSAEVESKIGKGFAGTQEPWGQFAACDYIHATRPETFHVRVYKTSDAKFAYDGFKTEQMKLRGDKGHVKDIGGTGTEAFWSFEVSEIAYMEIKNGKTVEGPKNSADFYAYKDGTLVWIEAHSDALASEKAFPDIAAYFARRALEKS